MDEPEVSQRAIKWLRNQGYRVKTEVPLPHPNGLREVVLDLHAYKDINDEPDIIWCECKGDVGMSQLLEGFIRLLACIIYGGSKGYLFLPHDATERILKYPEVLEIATNVMRIVDIETETIHTI